MYHAQPQGGAYAALEPALLDPKAAEARVVTQITRRMIAAWKDDGTPFPARAAILHDNRRLWTAVAAAVVSDQNALPDALRASLAGLAGFVDRETTKLLRGDGHGGDVRLLIEINRRIIAGLTEAA